MQNIEIKYRLPDPAALGDFLGSQDDVRFSWRHQQHDIYFRTASGRLKLRIEDEKPATLIEYHRPDSQQARISNYTLTPVENGQQTLEQLRQEHGILAEVLKIRTLYFYKNVRIHLDDVRQLGGFLEFESVISEAVPQEAAARHFDEIDQRLQGHVGEAVAVGYLDLLLNNH